MDELEVRRVFGLESKAGEEAQEAAEPAEDARTASGAEEQEAAAPASDGKEEEKTASGARGTTEEDGKYAAARRRAEEERDRMVARARLEERLRANDLIRRAGIPNPGTGRNMESLEELEALERERAARPGGAAEAGPAPAHPQLRDNGDAARLAAEQRERLRRRVDRDVREIARLDPAVRSIEDITGGERFGEILALVGRGNSLPDAYRLVHFDELAGRQARAAEQAERNRAAEKRHLVPTQARGEGAPFLTSDTIEAYRRINPEATTEEIRKYEAKYRKRKRG